VNVDRRHKLVRRYHVTDAAVHDSQAVDAILDPPRYPAWVAACPWVESPTPIPLFDRGPSLRPDLRIWQAAGRSGGQGGPKAIAAAAATCP